MLFRSERLTADPEEATGHKENPFCDPRRTEKSSFHFGLFPVARVRNGTAANSARPVDDSVNLAAMVGGIDDRATFGPRRRRQGQSGRRRSIRNVLRNYSGPIKR